MTTNPTTTARDDLTAIIERWDDLRDMLNPTSASTSWLPLMGMQHLERDEDEITEAAAERAERTAMALGERPVPIRLQTLDTITALDSALVHLADQIASSVQRPPLSAPKPAGPSDHVGLAVRLAAAQDAADARRWRAEQAVAADEYRAHTPIAADRTGLAAARWLLRRIDGEDGPFLPLRGTHIDQIAAGAAASRRHIEQALGITRREDPIARRCPCGGPMVMRQGGEQVRDGRPQPLDPEVQCRACGIVWSGPGLARLLDAA